MTLRNGPPVTVIAYVVIVAAALAVALVHDGPQAKVVVGGLVLVVASFGLWRGVWVAWLFLAVVEAGNLLVVLINHSPWWVVLLKTTMVALLLAQSTRRYARRRRRTRAVA